MNTLLNFAKEIDELISSDLDQPQFHLPARLYGRTNAGIELLGESDEPYQLLFFTEKPEGVEVCALVVTGWAAPTDDGPGTRPSQHKDRSRVRIVLSSNGADTFTVVRFANEPDDIKEMGAGGEGALPEALMTWWAAE
jgi:hypothetical protein